MNGEILQALRIPMKWTVNYNALYERSCPNDFTDKNYRFMYDFTEDILQLALKDVIIDVGWYPEFDENGKYTILMIYKNDWNKPVFKFDTKNKDELVQKIEHLLLCSSKIINSNFKE